MAHSGDRADAVAVMAAAEAEARALYQAALAIGAELDLDARLERVLASACQLLHLDQALIALLDPERDHFDIVSTSGSARPVQGAPQPVGQGLTGLVVSQNTPQRTGDLLADPRTWARQHARDQGARSWLGVPLAEAGEAFGALIVRSPHVDAFTEEHEQRLSALAALAGSAIREARLRQQVQAELAERTRTQEALRRSEERL